MLLSLALLFDLFSFSLFYLFLDLLLLLTLLLILNFLLSFYNRLTHDLI